MNNVRIGFATEKLKQDYENLEKGKHEEKQLHKNMTRAINDLEKNEQAGTRIPEKLWPQYYAKHNITNLWKYDLPNSWRLIYTLKGSQALIVAMLLEWFDHKRYEKRFGYKVK